MNKSFALEVRFVEFTARYLWKFLRIFLGRHLARRCKKCVLPDTCTTLNKEGLCPECEKFVPQNEQALSESVEESKKLDSILHSHENKGKWKYDAILLFSGGKDSAYMLHRITEEYPNLRLLCLLVDNGFMSPYALENAKSILGKFNVDSTTYYPRFSFVKKVFRYTLTNPARFNGYTTIDLMDGFVTFDSSKNLAAKLDIPLVLCGLSKMQVVTAFGPIGCEYPREKELKPLKEHVGINLREVFNDEEMNYWFDASKWPEEKVPRFVFPMAAWDLDEDFVLGEVERLDLISSKQLRPLMTNHELIPVIGMSEVANFGYCCWEVEFAPSVREGKSNRDYWLSLFEMVEYSSKTGRFINKSMINTLNRLDLSKKDIGIPD